MADLGGLEDDGLATPLIGAWAERKYRLVGAYARMFATSMKRKWHCRVYADLFAGSGRARIRGTKTIVASSPALSLGLPDPFDRYVFCEADNAALTALRTRTARDWPEASVEYVPGDVNAKVDEVMGRIPRGSRDYRVSRSASSIPSRCGISTSRRSDGSQPSTSIS